MPPPRRRSGLDPRGRVLGGGLYRRGARPAADARGAGRLRQAALALAQRCFSMEDALDRYEGLYRRVLGGGT